MRRYEIEVPLGASLYGLTDAECADLSELKLVCADGSEIPVSVETMSRLIERHEEEIGRQIAEQRGPEREP